MKREKFLWPLTQGHHRGLVMAKNIRHQFARIKPDPQENMAARLLSEVRGFWEMELMVHFEAEEELLTVFAGHSGPGNPNIARIISEHRMMKRFLDKGSKEDLLRFADILTSHIRYEEDVVFGRIEKILTPDETRTQGEAILKKVAPH